MTDDIRFTITADEQGAVASFKRLRQEILNNEHGLKSIGQEGKMSGKALKDMASFLGPEFQILGDRLDHVSGALQDIKGAGLLAKASLIGLVATAGFQVGQMIGNWVFETEKWKKELDDALKLSTQLNSEIAKNAGGRAAGMSPEKLQQEMVGLAESIQRQTEMVNKSEQAWSNFATADYWVIGENNRRKEVEGIKANIESQRELMKVYRDAIKQQAQKARAAEEAAIAQKEADAEKKRLDDERRALQAQEALTKAQDTFLEGLKLELV
jgi:polyhydroxyalkanoate synthesis regulator protein